MKNFMVVMAAAILVFMTGLFGGVMSMRWAMFDLEKKKNRFAV